MLNPLTKEFQESEVEIVEEKQQEKEIRLIGRQRKIQGLTLWEYNYKTNELHPAKFKKQDFQIASLTPSKSAVNISSKVQVNENCFYLQALNRRNAEKKIRRMFHPQPLMKAV